MFHILELESSPPRELAGESLWWWEYVVEDVVDGSADADEDGEE